MLAVKVLQSSQMDQPLIWKEAKILKVLFQITASGNYATGGDPLDLTQLFGLLAGAPGSVAPTFENVAFVGIKSMPAAPGPAAEFLYRFCLGSSLLTGKMQVLTGAAAQSGLTELNAGAYPAGVTGDTIIGEAYFVMP